MRSLRLSLTLSGGAALGAYQAGATAALLTAARHLSREDDERCVVDAMGGASAGALVAALGAHSLLNGIDPVWLLHNAWVDRVNLQLLRSRDARAPLGFEKLKERIDQVLDPRDDDGSPAHRVDQRQERNIGVHVALTGLQGLQYRVSGLRSSEQVTATTYVDWAEFQLEPGGGKEQLLQPEGRAPFDFVLASAANAGAFGPRLLDRRHEEEEYRERGVTNFPSSGRFWYTDGSTVQANPLGRVMGAADSLDASEGADVRRLNLLIDPRSSDPSSGQAWVDPDYRPAWTAALARTLSIIPNQILYDDLRRVEKANSRLHWAKQAAEELAPHLHQDAREALAGFLRQAEADRAVLRPGSDEQKSEEHDAPAQGADDGRSIEELLRSAFEEVAGLQNKRWVDVDVISPLLLAEGEESVPNLLAGEILGDFGGFASRRLRESDFVLGFDSVSAWMPEGLDHAGLDTDEIESTIEAVEQARLAGWPDELIGETQVSDLPLSDRLQLAVLAGQLIRVIARDAWKALRG